ncbi:hypothetical protein AVEN_257540-1 [Araneus ventricosus]|uniref:Retrotransposon gag domain-containing protein n=1 Tax=Araneus ventricosus TaxID=182803 RepID=A0A4Y2UKH7_ARAVE|nr:hypothetical protein AVEN_257540-1 [Araneus ventricosus]
MSQALAERTFLDGTAKEWFDNNEDLLIMGTFQTKLKKRFLETQCMLGERKDILKCSALKSGESAILYSRRLGLCHQDELSCQRMISFS